MDELKTLSYENLDMLPDAISRPNYARDQVSPGIVHIGVGNFHRAHQAWYLHSLMQQGKAMDWGIIGAGVRAPYDEEMRLRLQQQDFLTTLIELDPQGVTAEIIAPIIDYLPVEAGNTTLIAMMANPAIRIVSLTITEGGYYIDPTTGAFDADHHEVRYDAQNPDRPNTAFGAIIAALKLRKEQGLRPFTVMSCDNLESNGAVTRQTVVSLARLSEPDLADWIEESCCFPNSMVDCIVPATGEAERSLARNLGVVDQAPVTHENYRQWVIEDHFSAGRPDLQEAGVTFSNAVHDYELLKLRVLNGGHQILANAGEILSLQTIAECMGDANILSMFRKVQAEEIVPQVPDMPDMTANMYIKLIERRFNNKAIIDTTRRVAYDGSSRHSCFILPIIRERVDANQSVEGLALVEALWARMCEGTREDGSIILPNDPHWDRLNVVARVARYRPSAWLEQSQYYGDLNQNADFVDAFSNWLTMIWKNGVHPTLQHYKCTDHNLSASALAKTN